VVSGLSPERLAELRALAAAATPGPWEVDSFGRVRSPRINSTFCVVHRTTSSADAEFIAAVSPDVVVGLLDELDDERASYDGAMADLSALVEVARTVVDATGQTERLRAIRVLGQHLRLNYPEPGPVTIVSGDMAVELPGPPDQVVDLMDALERSVAAAKEARSQRPQPGSPKPSPGDDWLQP
jgi:hypothetical protein